MENYLKAIVAVLIGIILVISVSRQNKDISLLLTLFICCAVVTASVAYLQPVIQFIQKLQVISKMDSDLLEILLKTLGVGLLAEIMDLICADSGNASLGKAVQILAISVILWLVLPLLTQLLDLIENILGAL